MTDTILRAHTRAQRRFRRMVVEKSYGDPGSRTTRLYVQAERLIDRLRGEADAYRFDVRLVDAQMDALHDAYLAEMEELEEAEAQDARPWNLPDIPLADVIPESEWRAMWGDR